MGHQQHGLLPRRPPDTGDGPLPVLPVQPREGLIQGQGVGGRQQRPGQGQPPLHAAGEVPDRLFAHVSQPQLRQQGGGAFRVRSQHKAQVPHGVQLLQQPVLLKHGGPAAVLHAGDRAAAGGLQSQQDAQQGGLARARGRHDAGDAVPGGEGYVLQHRHTVILLAEVMYLNLHQPPAFRTSASISARNSFSNTTDTATMTAVQANRSEV